MTENNVQMVHTVAELRAVLGEWRKREQRIGMVPTMGALHAGHLSLVEQVRRQTERCVVSIFVNPTQFGPNEDLQRYPRTLDADLEKLRAAGVDLAYVPAVTEMYPGGVSQSGYGVRISVPGVSERWEGKQRPGHFDGVATVVTKLLLQCLPDIAIFGEKDYQQLQVIKRLATDLSIPVQIEGAPTVREQDGLAMSSRNAYLSTEEREIAVNLYRVLQTAAEGLQARPNAVAEILREGEQTLLAAGFGQVDYLALCDPADLQPLSQLHHPARLLVAARLGTVRLIDNLAVAPSGLAV